MSLGVNDLAGIGFQNLNQVFKYVLRPPESIWDQQPYFTTLRPVFQEQAKEISVFETVSQV
jgi:hypothetical protein